jgi:hypothetical protein
MDSILAQSSIKTYNRAWVLFLEFAELFHVLQRGRLSLPVSVANLSLYVSFLDHKGLAPTTISTYTSAISFRHKLAGVPDPTSAFVIQKLLQATRFNKRAMDTRLPITEDLLEKLCSASKSTLVNAYKGQLFRTMMITAFWGFMRVGEITAPTNSPDQALQTSDLSFSSDGSKQQATIVLRKFKHHRGGDPVYVKMESYQHIVICPVRSLITYLQCKQSSVGPLFAFIDGCPVPRSWFSTQLDFAVRFCGLNSSRYKTHSFRIGAASSAAARGLSDAQIRLKGRWRSDAFKRYIRPIA